MPVKSRRGVPPYSSDSPVLSSQSQFQSSSSSLKPCKNRIHGLCHATQLYGECHPLEPCHLAHGYPCKRDLNPNWRKP